MKNQLQLAIALCLATFVAETCAVTYLKIFFQTELIITKAERAGNDFSIPQGEILVFPAAGDDEGQIRTISNKDLHKMLAQEGIEDDRKTSYLPASAETDTDIIFVEALNVLPWSVHLPTNLHYNNQKQTVILSTVYQTTPIDCRFLRVDSDNGNQVDARHDNRFMLLTTEEGTARKNLGDVNTVFDNVQFMIMDKSNTDVDYEDIEQDFLGSPFTKRYIAIDQSLADDDFIWWEVSNGDIIYSNDKFAAFSFVIPPKTHVPIRFQLNEGGMEGFAIKHSYNSQICIPVDSKFTSEKEGGKSVTSDLQDLNLNMKQLQIGVPKKSQRDEDDTEPEAKRQKPDTHDWIAVTFGIVQLTTNRLIINFELQ